MSHIDCDNRKNLSERVIAVIISIFFIATAILGGTGIVYASGAISVLQPYGNYGDSVMGLSGEDISHLNLKDQLELVKTQTFDTYTVWPEKDKMPAEFDPQKVMEWGKDPGLSIRKFHEKGYTGKGVRIAYVDQPLLVSHNEYKDKDIIYTKIRLDTSDMNNTSMHGPAVLSLLSGKDIGVAPDSTVYFFGHPSWLMDQTTHAEALRELIKINKTLSKEKKIQIVGFSDGPDTREKNIDEYKKAIKEAENNGIMVIDVSSSLNISPLEIKYPNDKNDANQYEVAHWFKSAAIGKDAFFVPTGGRTTATGHRNDVKHYAYWTDGGLSWAVPYVVGTIALGLQIDPDLTKEKAFEFLKQSQIPYRNGGIINPEGFLKLVKQNYALKDKNTGLYILLYNSQKISSNDKLAIEDYAERLTGNKTIGIMWDTADYRSASDIYTALKQKYKQSKGKIKGIQIFGSSSDVPSFDIHFKVKMQDGIDDSGNFKSDLFYGSFDSDVNALTDDFSIYKAFEEKLKVSFVPQWSVARLPLSAGEIAPFINKYYDYSLKVKGSAAPYVNFSSPIFPQQIHSDDMGYFMKERLDGELKLLKNDSYRLYGNTEGLFPVTTDVLGGFDNKLLKTENQKGVANFIINSHGQQDNIDQCIYIHPEDLDKYKDRARSSSPFNGNKDLLELRVSFLNSDNINSILSKNYYTLTLWTCSNAFDLRNENLVHTAMSKGKAVDAMAASSIISNNGVNNAVSVENLKKNNFYYFMLEFFKNQSKGYSRSDGFFHAKKAYASEILKNTNLLGEGNYGFNLHNVLSFHYLGLIDISKENNTGKMKLPAKDIMAEINNKLESNAVTDHILLGDNELSYNSIVYRSGNLTDGRKITEVSAAVETDKVYIRIKYYSPQDDFFCVFLQRDTPGLKEYVQNGTKKGNNIVVLCFTKEELKKFEAGLAINIGSQNFISIDKYVTNMLCN